MTNAGGCRLCAIPVDSDAVLYADDTWLVRSISSTPAVAGWLLLQARRHVSDPAGLDATEAQTFGPLVQRLAALLKDVTGAVRVYIGSLNEGIPHFHCHLLPRLPEMPNNALGWNAFALSELARTGEVRADPSDVARVEAAIREWATTGAHAR